MYISKGVENLSLFHLLGIDTYSVDSRPYANNIKYFVGAGSGLVPMYLTEIAPINIRGAMGVLHQFALTCGILFSQIFGLRQMMGKNSDTKYDLLYI